MKRLDLRRLARAKLGDAKLLLEHGRASNAYYLSGYAIELALKACIAKQISEDTIPDKNFIKNVYSHDFPTLAGLAGLSRELKNEIARDLSFSANWAITCEWLPDARYKSYTSFEAQTLVEAVEHSDHGVLKWIRRFW
ncbi:HEPN domain-containing protein [Nitratireductor rhodophyticola]|uniref:HEPN domain-containing protein n=1 Tax=Nitratireductor rhodophyticola TaxID=2854036 RepID=UPI00300B217A